MTFICTLTCPEIIVHFHIYDMQVSMNGCQCNDIVNLIREFLWSMDESHLCLTMLNVGIYPISTIWVIVNILYMYKVLCGVWIWTWICPVIANECMSTHVYLFASVTRVCGICPITIYEHGTYDFTTYHSLLMHWFWTGCQFCHCIHHIHPVEL